MANGMIPEPNQLHTEWTSLRSLRCSRIPPPQMLETRNSQRTPSFTFLYLPAKLSEDWMSGVQVMDPKEGAPRKLLLGDISGACFGVWMDLVWTQGHQTCSRLPRMPPYMPFKWYAECIWGSKLQYPKVGVPRMRHPPAVLHHPVWMERVWN